MEKYESLKKEIESILPKSPLDFELAHAHNVLARLLEIAPKADEAMRIAALAHDIDRAITGITERDLKDYSKINEFKKEHSMRSAKFIEELMIKHNYEKPAIAKVKHLVENHEIGGDKESEVLMNADSLAYFDFNIPGYIKRNGKERAKKKIQFMYIRLSPQAQKLVQTIKYSDSEVEKLVKAAINSAEPKNRIKKN